jgi:hypothetical protein
MNVTQGLALTYCAPNPGDGSGAQIQRILALFATAKSVNIGYIHTEIADLGPNPGDSFDNLEQRKEFLIRLNQLIELPSDKIYVKKIRIKKKSLNSTAVKLLPVVRKILNYLKITLVIEVESVYDWIDKQPHHYERAVKILRDNFPKTLNSNQKLVIDCHIRRAIVPEFMADGKPNPRYTKDSYFQNSIRQISEISKEKNIELLIRVHTDVSSELSASREWRIPADISRETVNYWESLGIVEKDNLKLSKEILFDELAKFGTVEILSNIDPISAWRSMENSDILIVSKSSFSYIGGLIRGVKPVIFCNFWHSGLPTWLQFDEFKVEKCKELNSIVDRAMQRFEIS